MMEMNQSEMAGLTVGKLPEKKAVTRKLILETIEQLKDFSDEAMGIWIETLEGVNHQEGDMLGPVKVLLAFSEMNRNIRVNAIIRTLGWDRKYVDAVVRFNERLEFAKIRRRGYDAERGMESLVDPSFPMQYRNTLMDDLEVLQDELLLIFSVERNLRNT